MNSTEFLALRKIQKEGAATDYEVADESYQPDGTPPLPAWCA